MDAEKTTSSGGGAGGRNGGPCGGGATGTSFDETNDKTTAQNPNFVANYFASSRLHFIGSFRARYEAMMVEVAKRLNCSTERLLRDQAASTGRSKKRKRSRERIIVHVDMDCFFASVAVRDAPHLRGKPIAVCHSGAPGDGTSSDAKGGEISSCSYEARAFGVKAGMFFKRAKGLCPDLVAVAYDFDAYERVSVAIYSLFYSISERVVVEAKSVDEAYLDLTFIAEGEQSPSALSVDSVETVVQKLRQDIFDETGCHASAGIGSCKLLARLGTAKAKPNGMCRVQAKDSSEFLLGFRVKDLPGVGWKTMHRMDELGVSSCEDLRAFSLESLQKEFGAVSGRTFYDYCRGIDHDEVRPMQPRRSIGAEISWGVRFGDSHRQQLIDFITGVATEVARRCNSARGIPSKVTLKVYKKKPDSGRPGKYLGHGPCDILNKSAPLPSTSSGKLAHDLSKTCVAVYMSLKIPNKDMRGLAVQVHDIAWPSLDTQRDADRTGKIGTFYKRTSMPSTMASEAREKGQEALTLDHVEEAGVGISPSIQVNAKTVTTPRNVSPTLRETTDEVEAGVAPLEFAKDDGSPGMNGSNRLTQIARRHGLDPDTLRALPREMRREGFMKEQLAIAAKFQNAGKTELPAEMRRDGSRKQQLAIAATLKGVRDGDSCPSRAQHGQPPAVTGASRDHVIDDQDDDDDDNDDDDDDDQHPHQVDESADVDGNLLKNGDDLSREGHTKFVPDDALAPIAGDGEVCDDDVVMQIHNLQEIRAQIERSRNTYSVAKRHGQQLTLTQLCRGPLSEAENESRSDLDISSDDIDAPSQPPMSLETSQVRDASAGEAVPGASGFRRGGVLHGVAVRRAIYDSRVAASERLFADESLVSYAPKLREWIAGTANDVRSAHAILLRTRCVEMVQQRKFARANAELSFIRQAVDEVGGDDWAKAFNSILDYVQSEMQLVLGRRLAIRGFPRRP